MSSEIEFQEDAKGFLAHLEQLHNHYRQGSPYDAEEAFRLIHSLKSEASFLDKKDIVQVSHRLEEKLLPLKEGRVSLSEELFQDIIKSLDRMKALVFYQEGQPRSQEDQELMGSFEKKLLGEAILREEKFYRLRIQIDPEEQMSYARAFLVQSNLEQFFQVIKTIPSLEEQKPVYTLDLYLTTKKDKREILKQALVDRIVSTELIELPFHSFIRSRDPDPLDAPPGRDLLQLSYGRLEELKRYYRQLSPFLKGIDTPLQQKLEGMGDLIFQLSTVSVGEYFKQLPGRVQALAKKKNKEARFILKNPRVEIDRRILDRLSEALTHLVRNSLAHGIEAPQVRLNSRKKAEGLISLSVEEKGEEYVLTYTDNGRGIQEEALRRLAKNRGYDKANLSLLELLSLPGVSTQSETDLFAGRGVGFELIRKIIQEDLGGRIRVGNAPGRGVKFQITIPRDQEEEQLLIFRSGSVIYGIPTSNVEGYENLEEISVVSDQSGLFWEDGLQKYPVFRKGVPLQEDTLLERFGILCRNHNKKALLVCDEILYEQKISLQDFSLSSTGEKYHYYLERPGEVKEYIYLDPAFL